VLVYGAGDLDRVLAANLTLRPRALRQAAAWLATRPFRELEPERYIALIAPRPLVMVNGIDDPQMPRAAVEALFAAAREPKSIVWLRTGHLMPTDSTLIRALVDTALARLPVLRGARRTGETASGDRAAGGSSFQQCQNRNGLLPAPSCCCTVSGARRAPCSVSRAKVRAAAIVCGTLAMLRAAL